MSERGEGAALGDAIRPSALATIRSELEGVRAAVLRIENELAGLEQEDPGAPFKERSRRYYEVLSDVYDRGGRLGLDVEEFGRVGDRHGYDRRGLGGFFTGARAPLRRQDGSIVLTPYGERMLDFFLLTLQEEATDGP